MQVYEKNQVFEKFFEYPLEVNITVRLVQGLRPGFPNKAEVAIDGQAVWSSQKEMALPTRAHIGMPRGHRYPVKCRRYSPMATTYKGPGVYHLNSCVPVIRDAGMERPTKRPRGEAAPNNDTVTFNVGGKIFEILRFKIAAVRLRKSLQMSCQTYVRLVRVVRLVRLFRCVRLVRLVH